MFAVIKVGGSQHRVAVGEEMKVERLAGEVGQKLEFGEVLLLSREEGCVVGTPNVAGAKVVAEIVGQGRGKTVDVCKFKRRTKYRRKNGHRQEYTKLKVTEIVAP
jgi:large subunit ribosomal protein L21